MKKQLIALCGALALVAGCSSSSSSSSSSGGSSGGSTGSTDAGSYVGLGIRVDSPSGRTTYLGAYKTMPSGTLDTSKMVQFTNTDMSFYGGAAYVWDRDAVSYTKYTTDADGTLHKGKVLSFANLGVQGSAYSTYASSTVAYAVLPDQLNAVELVVWNPTDMTITDSVALPSLNAPNATDYDEGGPDNKPLLFGKYLAIIASWDKSDYSHVSPDLTVALVDTTNLHGDVTVLNDPRCLGATASFIDPSGDFYVSGTGEAAAFNLFPTNPANPPNGCILRIKNGETAFDASYKLDLVAATSTKAVYQTWHINGDKVLAMMVPSSEQPADIDSFYTTGTVSPYLVDVSAQTATAINTSLSGHFENYYEWRIGDDLYYEDYTLTNDGTRTSTFALFHVAADGTFTQTFTGTGDMWAIGQLTPQ